MYIHTLTITGADDKVRPEFLYGVSACAPEEVSVEWGILASESKAGSPRYPSMEWILRLLEILDNQNGMTAALHICGNWMREILLGNMPLDLDFSRFRRIQFNFKDTIPYNSEKFINLWETYFSYNALIFQVNMRGNLVYQALVDKGERPQSCLFDCSGGTGKLSPWRKVVEGSPGYAGGLTPDNLEEQLYKIERLYGEEPSTIWIDIESGVRNERNELDCDKVFKAIEIVDRWNRKI